MRVASRIVLDEYKSHGLRLFRLACHHQFLHQNTLSLNYQEQAIFTQPSPSSSHHQDTNLSATFPFKMTFFPCYSNDLSPLFHLLDDYDHHRLSRPKQQHQHHQHHQHRPQPTQVRSFTPKFDLREMNDSFYLDGELPGVDQNNVNIEFSDPHTLVINGRVEHNYNTNSEAEEQQGNDETSSNKSRQPTVEDEDAPNSSPSVASPVKPADKAMTEETSLPLYKYRVSERAIGSFHRAFTFAARFDQDAVKATLRNGILSLVIPKEPTPKMKKIRVE